MNILARMNIDAIPAGSNPPEDINVVIEIPVGGEPIKYELDKASGALFVDRFLYTPMRYPGNYGFVPHTLSGDGDPVDVMVVTIYPLIPGSVIQCRPVGVLKMTDEINSLKADGQKIKVNMFWEIREVLTPKQRSQLQLIKERYMKGKPKNTIHFPGDCLIKEHTFY